MTSLYSRLLIQKQLTKCIKPVPKNKPRVPKNKPRVPKNKPRVPKKITWVTPKKFRKLKNTWVFKNFY